MAFVCCCDSYLAVAAASNVFIVKWTKSEDASQLDESRPVILPASVSSPSCTKDKGREDSNEGCDTERQQSADSSSSVQVLAARFSNSGRLFAVCNNRKQLIVWRNSEGRWVQHRQWILKKQATALTFAGKDDDAILVADRYGQVTEYRLEVDQDAPGTVLLGHVSLLLDLCLSNNGRFLITSDRDEKIRVSHYPKCYDIQSFCLGHREYVKTLCICPGLNEIDKHDGILASGGGDGFLRLWRCTDGSQLASFKVGDSANESGAPGTSQKRLRKILCLMLTSECDAPAVRLALLFEESSILGFVDIQCSSSGDYLLSKYSEWSDQTSTSVITDISNTGGRLFALLQNPSDQALIEIDPTAMKPTKLQNTRALDTLNVCETLVKSLAEAKEELPPVEKVVQYNNIDEYLQRKRTRMGAHSDSSSANA